MSRIHRPPMSLSGLVKNMSKDGRDGKTAVVVGTITDDNRMSKLPKLKVRVGIKTCQYMFWEALHLMWLIMVMKD